MSTPTASQPLLPVLTVEQIQIIAEQELANALAKVASGGSLTKRERELIDAAGSRGKATAPAPGAAPTPSARPAASAKPLTRSEIQQLYPDPATGVPITTRTVDRINAVAALPDVATPAPWHDAHQLADWYRTHYRSDLSKPAPAKPRALPPWLSHALTLRPPAPVPVPAEPIPAAAQAPPPEMDPETAALSALAFAERLEQSARSKWAAVQHDPTQEPAARRAYMETLTQLQQARERSRKAGDDDALPREDVARQVATLHSRIIRTLTRELILLRRDALRASASPDTWAEFARSFIHGTCRGMVASGFADPDTAAA